MTDYDDHSPRPPIYPAEWIEEEKPKMQWSDEAIEAALAAFIEYGGEGFDYEFDAMRRALTAGVETECRVTLANGISLEKTRQGSSHQPDEK